MVAGIGLEWLKQGLGCCSGERELLGAAGWEVMLLRVFPGGEAVPAARVCVPSGAFSGLSEMEQKSQQVTGSF